MASLNYAIFSIQEVLPKSVGNIIPSDI